MKQSTQKKLRILEISLWSIFFIIVMAGLNNYLMEERLLFYKTDQEKIILGSSWGKSSNEVLTKSQYNSSELSVKYYNKINLNGREIDLGRNFFKYIEGCSFDIDGYNAKIDYSFFYDQLFAISITGDYRIYLSDYLQGNNVYEDLVSNKYGEFKNECSNILFFFEREISDELRAKISDGFVKCIYTENLNISYVSWENVYSMPEYGEKYTNNDFIIRLIYKPIIKEIELKN